MVWGRHEKPEQVLGDGLVKMDDIMMYLGSTVLGLPVRIFILLGLLSFGA